MNNKKGVGGVCFCITNNLSFSDVNIPSTINALEVIEATMISGTLAVNACNPRSILIDVEDLSRKTNCSWQPRWQRRDHLHAFKRILSTVIIDLLPRGVC